MRNACKNLSAGFGGHLARIFLGICVTGLCSGARANGRQPNTTGVVVDASNPNRMLAGATFGAMVSTDGGLNWHWVCEEVLGGSSSVDAQVAISKTGTLLVANPSGIFESSDDGCTWTQAGTVQAPLQTTQLALHPSDANQWLVAVNDISKSGGFIYQTIDAGASFAPLPQPMARVYLYSVAFAPSLPSRVYAGGSNNAGSNSAYLLRSDDAGQSWTASLVSGAPDASAQTRVAVSPIDPNIVLVGAQNVSTSGASVLRSADGGKTFALSTTMTSTLRELVFSADGTQVFAASQAKITHSTDAGQSFTLLATPMYNACIGLQADVAYACGNEASGDTFTLGRSTDDGATWETLVDLAQIQGPFGCAPATNTYATCMPLWASEAGALGAPVQPVTRLPAPLVAGGPDPGAESSGGCHCREAAASGPVWLGLFGLVALRRGRRRLFR